MYPVIPGAVSGLLKGFGMYIVTTVNKATKFWLHGIAWAFNADRADRFETSEQASAAITKASKFMAAPVRKACRIQLEGETA